MNRRVPWLPPALALAALAGCGGGGDAAAPVPAPAAAVWLDADRLQLFGAAQRVELGFDGRDAFIAHDGARTALGPGGRADLAYIGDSGAPAAGQGTQWLAFELRGDGYFSRQGQHLPLVLRFAQYPDPRRSGSAPRGVEGKMVFLGRDGAGLWDCAAPQVVGVYFETRVSGRDVVPDVSGVKCADAQPGLQDGLLYRVRIEADAHQIRYHITDAAGAPVSAGATADTDYPPLAWNQSFLQALGPAGAAPYGEHWRALQANTSFAFLAALTDSAQPWSLSFSAIASGWLP